MNHPLSCSVIGNELNGNPFINLKPQNQGILKGQEEGWDGIYLQIPHEDLGFMSTPCTQWSAVALWLISLLVPLVSIEAVKAGQKSKVG